MLPLAQSIGARVTVVGAMWGRGQPSFLGASTTNRRAHTSWAGTRCGPTRRSSCDTWKHYCYVDFIWRDDAPIGLSHWLSKTISPGERAFQVMKVGESDIQGNVMVSRETVQSGVDGGRGGWQVGVARVGHGNAGQVLVDRAECLS